MKKITAVLFVLIMTIAMCSCASMQRAGHDIRSDFAGGLNRTVRVYTADGELMAEYKGKIDLAPHDEVGGGVVKFDFNGKRYIYYNCFVETVADL